VTNAGGFGAGVYRLFNYSGSLTNNVLTLSTVPAGFTPAKFLVQTAQPGEVDLLVSDTPFATQYWNGSQTVADHTIHGGTATWNNVPTNTDWTNASGSVTAPWENGFAIFDGTAGTVTLGDNIRFFGMQFVTSGYMIVAPGNQVLIGSPTSIFQVGPGATATIAAPIVDGSSPTEIVKDDGGTLILTGTNTYTDGTVIGQGTLQIGNGGATGSIVGNVTDNASLVVDRSGSLTLAGTISGTGSLTQSGSGTLILTGADTYTGGTTISAGTLQIGNGGSAGTIQGNITNNAALVFDLSNRVNFNGTISGTGSLTQNGSGTLVLTGANTYSGGTNFNSGIVAANSDANLGTGPLSFNGGTLEALASGGGIASSKALILNAGGGTFLTDAGTRSVLNGTISGPGDLTQSGSGLLILTGADTYSGGTTITSGSTLQLGTGGTSGSIVGNVVDNGLIIFNRSDTVTFGGVISGSGAVQQNGSGTTILSGTNTYSGGTTINAGTLTVNNSQALGLGNVVVNGGILNADPQPINVKGNYTQNAGGALQLTLGGASVGQYDFLSVGGRAALGGTLQLFALNGFQPKVTDRLTLVIAGGGVSGVFATVLDPFSALLRPRLIYGPDTVVLAFSSDFTPYARTPNQKAAARLLNAIQFDPKAGNLLAFLETEPLSNLTRDLAEISPDGLTSLYEITFSNANIQRLNLEGRLEDLRAGSRGFSSNMKLNGAAVYFEDKAAADGKGGAGPIEAALQPGPENRWGVWATGFGDFANVDQDYNAHGYDFTTGGLSVGVDYRITDQLAIGAMGEYAYTWTNLKPSGDVAVNSGRGGVYATWFARGFYWNGAIYGGHNVYSTSRAALRGMASGGTGGGEFNTFMSAGYDFQLGRLTVGPAAALQYTNVDISNFSEHGSLAPLDIHSQSAQSLRTDFGLIASYLWPVGKVLVEPNLRAAWEHEYKYSALPITAGFSGIPGPSDTFYGPSEGHDSAIISAGVSVQWTPMIETYVNYDGQLGRDRYDSNAVTGGVRISL